MPDEFFDADEIRASTFIRHVEIHESLGSTNDRAKELAFDSNVELPALIVARNQTAGRGRGTNNWHSSVGALTFSILFDASETGLTPDRWPRLSLTTAVAVCDALAHELHPGSGLPDPRLLGLAIKWPNDVMLHGAKVAGILIESPNALGMAKNRLIIGIGLNVNNTISPSGRVQPGECRKSDAPLNAISLGETTGRTHDLHRVVVNVLNAQQRRIAELASSDPKLPAEWAKLDWLAEQSVEVHSNGTCVDGISLQIREDGALVLENVFGQHAFYNGTVRLRC